MTNLLLHAVPGSPQISHRSCCGVDVVLRLGLTLSLSLGFLPGLIPGANGQAPRETYRAAYQNWRDLDPSLEADAANPRGGVASRVQPMTEAANRYVQSRADYLETEAQDTQAQAQQLTSLGLSSLAPLADPGRMQGLLDSLNSTLTRMLGSYAGTNDAALARLRGALQEEQNSLTAVGEALTARRIRTNRVAQAQSGIDSAAGEALQGLQKSVAARRQTAETLRQEAPAWAAYYEVLGGAGGTSSAAPANQPGQVTPLRSSIASVPLSRYTGSWSFPVDGLFHGAQPSSLALEVRESGGVITGSLNALFLLPAGSPGDPTLTFTFEGNLQAERNQIFPLTTAEGAAGTIELIPGPAFNLLEVNFQTDPVENKVRTGNFILLKN